MLNFIVLLTSFLKFEFCGTHKKPHGARVLCNQYHMRCDTKLGHVTCAIRNIPCECNQFTYIIYKPWYPGVPPHQQSRYQPVNGCTYWPLLE